MLVDLEVARRAVIGDGTVPVSPPSTSPDVLASELVAAGVAPCVAAGCAVRRGGEWRSEVGGDVNRLFDLASLTKPMTALAVALSAPGAGAQDSRGLPRVARLGERVPDLRDTASGDASLELLLSHRAGLLGHIAIFQPLLEGRAVDAEAALRVAANARREECRGPCPDAGFAPAYSDLGYALAGVALARHTGLRDAGEAIGLLVSNRLDLRGTLGTARELTEAGVDVEGSAAPTEWVDWRGGLVRGRVHDENAWALTGPGGSGHAGMFGTAAAVLRFGQAVLDGLEGHGPFAASDLAWLTAERPGGTLRAGFDAKSPQGSSAGERFGPRSFGHLGFTGTSLWIDPDAAVVAVLLTNRVCPSRAHDAIRAARPRAHDALHAYAGVLAARIGAGG
jgi:CubicO group peptidase (beta-lactamase class C family)